MGFDGCSTSLSAVVFNDRVASPPSDWSLVDWQPGIVKIVQIGMTFIIGIVGIVKKVFTEVQVSSHGADVLAALRDGIAN
jgi:hypothetical protein